MAFGLMLASVLVIANSGLIKYASGCDGKCHSFIAECGESCLKNDFCPRRFPPFLDGCTDECKEKLLACKDLCFDDSDCGCPNPKKSCFVGGQWYNSLDCCNYKLAYPCQSWYCPGPGQKWQCMQSCPPKTTETPPPGGNDTDCLCPDIKKDKCPKAGVTIKNKACCEHNPDQGCSEFYCPGDGMAWQCTAGCKDCNICPNTKVEKTCPLSGAHLRIAECCKEPDSDGCAVWFCPTAGGPWQCQAEC